MIQKTIKNLYQLLFQASPWIILLGVFQYNFRPNFGMDRFQGPEFFDFFSITDLYVILLCGAFLFALLTKSIKIQPRPLPATVAAGVTLILLAGFIQIEFQAVFEPVLSTPFKYFRSLFLLPFLYCGLIWFSLNQKNITRLLQSYCLMITFISLLSLIQFFFQPFPGDPTDFTGRLSWPYVDFITLKSASANWIAFLSLPALIISTINLINATIKKAFSRSDFIYLITFIFSAAVIYLAQSYGSYAAFFIATTIYLFQVFKPKKFLIAFIFLAIIASGIYAIQRQSLKVQILEGAVDYKFNNSVTSRADIYKMNFFMIRQRPIIGVGLNQYQSYFAINQETALGHSFNESHVPPHAHNFFLGLWISLGIFGFIGALLLMIGALWQIKFNPAHPAFFALAAIMVHGLIDSYYWRPEIAYVIWMTFIFSYHYQIPALKKRV